MVLTEDELKEVTTEIAQEIADERAKLDSYKKSIETFCQLTHSFYENLTKWQEGREFMECEVCGNLCRKKSQD